MEILGKWLLAGAILCGIVIFSLKDEKDSGKIRAFLFFLCLILGVAGYNCLSDENSKKTHGEGISFGGTGGDSYYVELYSCNAYFANGSYACKVKVKSKGGILYAFPDGSTLGERVHNAPYDSPGAYFTYWAGAPIYF